MNYGLLSLSQQTMTFTQPILSSNGSLGGSSFAITSWLKSDGSILTGQTSGHDTINLLNSTVTSWGAPFYAATYNDVYFVLYNPQPLKISSFEIGDIMGASAQQYNGYSSNHAGYGPAKQITIYGSNNNSTWTQLTIFNNNSKLNSFTINVNSSTNYKYHKFVINSAYTYSASMASLKINATYNTSAYNNITFPYSHYSYNSYGAGFSYVGGASTSAYISSKTASGISLKGVDTSSSSASYLTIGY